MPYADPTSEVARASQKRRDAKHYSANKEKHRLAMRAWREKNRDYSNAWMRGYNARHPTKKMLTAARSRAREKGLEFTITAADITIPEACPVLGIALVRRCGNRTGGSPTLDRRDNSLGYVPGNVVVISHRANRLKADATLEEILAIARYMGQ